MSAVHRVLEEAGAQYAVVSSRAGARSVEFGDASALPYRHLVDRFFSESSALAPWFEFLDGAVLPQVVSQGSVVCVLTLLPGGDLVGVFAETTKKGAALHLWAEALESKLKNAMG